MKTGLFIAPTDLRDYAKAKGWVLVTEAISDRLYVLNNPHYPRRQLVFPMDTTASDYNEAVRLTAEKLAEMEGRQPRAILAALQEVHSDTLRLRIATDRDDERTLPLPFAASALAGSQKLLLAAACTVLKPQAHHPRLSRSEAQQFLDVSQFRHTEPGSFVLKVSCPVNALDLQVPLLADEQDAPFVRRATLTLKRALRELVQAIESDTLAQFVDKTRHSPTPIVSSNLCEAVMQFQDQDLGNSLEIDISWAASLPQNDTGCIRIQYDYFSRVEEVRRALRSSEKDHEDTFIGTVERLDGEMEPDGRRAGEVILALLLTDGETVRARAILNAEQYEKAASAHLKEGAYVQITGRLHPGRQPRTMTDISAFEVILRKVLPPPVSFPPEIIEKEEEQ